MKLLLILIIAIYSCKTSSQINPVKKNNLLLKKHYTINNIGDTNLLNTYLYSNEGLTKFEVSLLKDTTFYKYDLKKRLINIKSKAGSYKYLYNKDICEFYFVSKNNDTLNKEIIYYDSINRKKKSINLITNFLIKISYIGDTIIEELYNENKILDSKRITVKKKKNILYKEFYDGNSLLSKTYFIYNQKKNIHSETTINFKSKDVMTILYFYSDTRMKYIIYTLNGKTTKRDFFIWTAW